MRFFRTINKFCKDFKPLIETIGIVLGLCILLLTLWSTFISKELLELSQEQQFKRDLPIWDVQIIDSSKTIVLRQYNPDIKIQLADIYFPKEIVWNERTIPLYQPDFSASLQYFKDKLEKRIDKSFPVDIDCYDETKITYTSRNLYPLGLTIYYSQFGQLHEADILYQIQYSAVHSPMLNMVVFEGVILDRYLCTDCDIQALVNNEANKVVIR